MPYTTDISSGGVTDAPLEAMSVMSGTGASKGAQTDLEDYRLEMVKELEEKFHVQLRVKDYFYSGRRAR